jgi:hypothetical protein
MRAITVIYICYERKMEVEECWSSRKKQFFMVRLNVVLTIDCNKVQ